MNDSARAWTLDVAAGQIAAVGEKELQEVLCEPPLQFQPAAPAYRRHTLDWRGLPLEVIDLSVLFGAPAAQLAPRWVTVAACLPEDASKPQFLALALQAAPARIEVTNAMACALPETALREYLVWTCLSVCCFRHESRPIPVLDLARLLSPRNRQRLERYCTGWRRASAVRTQDRETIS
jgi:hypothetical protein